MKGPLYSKVHTTLFNLQVRAISHRTCCKGTNCPDITEFEEDVLVPLLQGYDTNDTFRTDEITFHYTHFPSKTYCWQSEKAARSKTSKDNVMLMFFSNMTGSKKLPLMLLGKMCQLFNILHCIFWVTDSHAPYILVVKYSISFSASDLNHAKWILIFLIYRPQMVWQQMTTLLSKTIIRKAE